MKILEGKSVAEKISSTFEKRLESVRPHIAVLGISGDEASDVYVKRIEKNCSKYNIGFSLNMVKTEQEFIKRFNEVKNDSKITGIMFQQPLPQNLLELIDEVNYKKDIEGIGINNMGKLVLGEKDVLIPCTSKAVIEILDFYDIDLTGKKAVIVGRSNIVGKPLIPQLLAKNATVTICHSKTENLKEEVEQADVVVMAIGKAKFLKADMIKQGAILIDVGINVENGKIVGDIDFEDIQDKAYACTPVPGGIGVVTNSLLIDNIIKSCEI